MRDDPVLDAALKRLKWPLRLTWAALAAERVTRAFWPVWTILFATFAALAFGLLDVLPLWADWGGLGAAALALIWAAIAGARRMRWPDRDAVLDRLDRDLPGRPLAALRDRQAVGTADAASAEVWRAHVLRMAARALGARARAPDLRISDRDPLALRYLALIAFVMALGFGSPWRVLGVRDLTPGPGAALAAGGPAWEGWVEPPGYTGKPSVYLNGITRSGFAVPVGSRVILRLYGKPGALRVAEDVAAPAQTVSRKPAQTFKVARSGTVSIKGTGGRSWDITATPDAPPKVRFVGPVRRKANGEMEQDFAASDDYGVVRGHATIRLDRAALDRRYGLAATPEPRAPITLPLPMPISGSQARFTQTLRENLSKNAWANLPVTVTLTVRDAAGNVTTTKPHKMVLPGRRFFDPLAAAVIEMRRDLLWSRANGARTAQILRAITDRPEGFIRSERAYLLLRVTIRRLEAGVQAGLTPKVRDEVCDALWQAAVLIEDGTLANAMQQLQRAQDRLSQAIRRGASKDEIRRLMQDMQDAMRNYIRQLAQQQQQNGNDRTAQNGPSMKITGEQLQQMLDKLQSLMEQGRMAEAQQLLNQLEQLMQNLRVTQGKGGMGLGGPNPMQGLADTLRQQQGLSDRAFRDLQKQPAPDDQTPDDQAPGDQAPNQQGSGGQQQARPGQGMGQGMGQGTDQGDGRALAQRQKALRDQLRRQSQQALPGAGTPDGRAGREALDRAGRAMQGAEQALRDNDLPGALDKQAEAMDALREGMRSLGRAMARDRQQAEGDQGGTNGQDSSGQSLDPLGRKLGQVGRMGSDMNVLQGEDVYRRARQILDALRKRLGNPDLPEVERDYLKRLLQPF